MTTEPQNTPLAETKCGGIIHIPHCKKCGHQLRHRKPGTREQAWVGTWYACEVCGAFGDSVLYPSPALRQIDAALAKANGGAL